MLVKVCFVQVFFKRFRQREWSMLQVGDFVAQLTRVTLGRIQKCHEIFGLEAEPTVNFQGFCGVIF